MYNKKEIGGNIGGCILEAGTLTSIPGDLDERSFLIFLTCPLTVTSFHSPGLTPDSNTPTGLMKATPLVVTPSYSPNLFCQDGAMDWRERHSEKAEVW